MAVNVDANLSLLRADRRPAGALRRVDGRVVVNMSKNVHAPGPGAAAYSASKASLTQLARVAALEWASQGIRVNLVHPNAVFDTGIWDQHTIESRAASYGLSVEEYRTNNLLGVEITSRDVAAAIVALCSAGVREDHRAHRCRSTAETSGSSDPYPCGTSRSTGCLPGRHALVRFAEVGRASFAELPRPVEHSPPRESQTQAPGRTCGSPFSSGPPWRSRVASPPRRAR